MKLKEFVNSDFNYIFDAACILYVDDEEIEIDVNTKDEEIEKYFERNIIMIYPISLKKDKMIIEYDPIEESVNLSMPLGFGILLSDKEEDKEEETNEEVDVDA